MRRMGLGWLLLAATACWLGWLLFVVHLDAESLWYDEWFTWEYSRQGPVALVNATANDVHPPAYYLWVWAWMQWTQSDDVFVMRLSSAIPAALAVALCFRVGADWFGSRWVGLGAAVFLATTGIFVYYARELRMYTLVVLMGLAGWWLLWRWLRERPVGVSRKAPARAGRHLLGYAALVGLMAYTYYFTAFMVAMQALAALLVAPRRFARLMLAYGAALLAFAPWLPVLYRQLVLESQRAGRGDDISLSNIGKFAATQATSWETIHEFVATYTANEPAFILLLLALAFMVGARHGRAFAMTALWFFGTLLLFWGVNLVIPVYALRYTLMIVPAMALLVGVALERLPVYRPAVIGVVGCLGIIMHSSAFLEPKPPHRELMQTLSANYQPGDRIWYNLDYGALGSSLQFERAYHLEHQAPNISTDDFVWDAPRDFEDVETTPRVWDARPYWIPMPDGVREALLAGRAPSEEYRFGAYFLRLYEAPPDELPITFSDLLALEITPVAHPLYRPGDTVRLKTWWRALDDIPLDYSYGLYLRDGSGAVLAQVDQGLQIGDAPTSRWQPSSGYGLAMPTLTLPAALSSGEYGLWMATYYWEDPRPLPVSAPDGYVVDRDTLLVRVAQIAVQ